ncbi:MAG: hypothetical protein KAY03_00825 [Arenimonas sp.]|nr:hypothetical protein [Arenimonas sp.]
MILRRLSQSLKEQNWTAIIIEFVLLVTGVFLGIQVSNWNAERATRQKSAIFTARLMTDLRVEAWAYQYLIEYQRDVQANARRALDGFDGSQPLSDEQLVIAAYRATQYESQDRHRATYDELVSTGTIGLITNQKMRDTAMMVYATTLIDQTLDEGKQSEYRLIFRRTLPAQVQQALLERCGDKIITPLDYAGIVHSLDYPCTLDLPEETISAAAQALRTRDELVPALRLRFADTGTVLFNLLDSNSALVNNLREFRSRK